MVTAMDTGRTESATRRGARYWGPVLIVAAVALGSVCVALFRDSLLWITLSLCVVAALAGVTLIAASRLDD